MEFTPGNELRQCNTDLLRTKSKKKKHKIRTEHTPFSKVILLPKMSFYSTMLIDEREQDLNERVPESGQKKVWQPSRKIHHNLLTSLLETLSAVIF